MTKPASPQFEKSKLESPQLRIRPVLSLPAGAQCASSHCAAKIAAAVDAGIMGYRMYLHDREFRRGEGIVSDSVDKTIRNVGILAQQGMLQTDRTILEIMQQK